MPVGEIKYRAWDKKRRFDMAQVLILDFNERYVVVDASWNENHETGESECVATFDEIELMQFTGLHDKDGKEIYESDIVLWKYINHSPANESGMAEVYYSTEHGASYKLHAYDNSLADNWAHLITDAEILSYEIIGNIHENPELLKEAHDL